MKLKSSFRNLVRLTVFMVMVTAVSGCGKRPPAPVRHRENANLPNGRQDFKRQEFSKDAEGFRPRLTPRPFDVLAYELKGEIRFSDSTLLAELIATVQLTDAAQELVLDSRIPGIEAVWDDQGANLDFEQDNELGELRIRLDAKAGLHAAGDVLKIHVRYLAPKPDGIAFYAKIPGDPVESRIAFTDSEPQGARFWFPCHDDPTDRARVAIEFTMDAGDRMIANGRLTKNQPVSGGKRVMRYETDYAIPTYITAFALGEFRSYTGMHGEVPVSAWARRGLPVDLKAIVDATITQMSGYEKLLVPYPYEKYAVVLLPNYSGMENVGITFNSEPHSSSAANQADLELMAHELGHQWFGDLVTVSTWDDLWIKEGMATLLEAEASRGFEDRGGSGRLFGDHMAFDDGDAIRDRALAPDLKYTSGPYARSGWLLTQLRRLSGEKEFWTILRGILKKHAFGSIGSEEFLEEFRGVLGDARLAQALKALDVRKSPSLEIGYSAGQVSLKLADPDGTFLVPMDLEWRKADGSRRRVQLDAGREQILTRGAGEFLVTDPADVHPSWKHLADIAGGRSLENYQKGAGMLQFDGSAEALAVLLAAPADHQISALLDGSGLGFQPEDLAELSSKLSSERAKLVLIEHVCREKSEGEHAIWKAALAQAIEKGASPLYTEWDHSPVLEDCFWVADHDLFEEQYHLVLNHPSDPKLDEGVIELMTRFPAEPARALQAWGSYTFSGPTMRTRLAALHLMVSQFALLDRDSMEQGEVEEWLMYFRRAVGDLAESSALKDALTPLVGEKDPATLPVIASVITDSGRRLSARLPAVCAAWSIADGRDPLWKAFVAELGELSTLPQPLRDAVEKPADSCAQLPR